MAASDQYRDYVKHSFLRYSFSIIDLLSTLVGLFLFINMEQTNTEGNEKNNTLLTEILDRQVGNYGKGPARFISDYRILEALKNEDSGRVTEVNRLFYEFFTRQSIRCSLVLTDSGGTIVSPNLLEGDRDIFLNSTVYQSSFEKMTLKPDEIFTLPSRPDYAHGQEGDLILSWAVPDSSKVLGYLFSGLPDEQIYETVRNYPLDDMILTDRYDNLTLSIGRQSADPMGKYPAGKYKMGWGKGDVVRVNGKRYHVQKKVLPKSTLVLYILVSMEFQRTLVSYSMLFLGLVGILMLVMTPPLIFRITRKNLEAIDELQTSIVEMGHDNVDCKLGSQVFDESKILGDASRKMISQREELMLYDNEPTKRKQVVEVKQLEEQFNPHFIFSMLETLRYEIVIDGARVSDMVMAFTNLVRYNIHYGSTVVPPQADIKNISDCLLLQKMHYSRRLNYYIDAPEELLGCRVPKPPLQPMVENSLVHGMKGIHSAFVATSAWMAEGNLKLYVEGNNSGISEEKLEEFRGSLEQEDIYREHIGLYDFYRVVRLLYGPACGMAINNSPGKGTRVAVTLPAEMEDGYV